MSLLDVLTKNTRRTRQEIKKTQKGKESNRSLLKTSVGEETNEERKKKERKEQQRREGNILRLERPQGIKRAKG